MLAMALLLHGGLLGEIGGEAAGVDGSGEGAWTLATPAEGASSLLQGPVSLLTSSIYARQGHIFAQLDPWCRFLINVHLQVNRPTGSQVCRHRVPSAATAWHRRAHSVGHKQS